MRLKKDFYKQDVLVVAPDLLGKHVIRRFDNGKVERRIITETESYGGMEDLASHARIGKTQRNRVMFTEGGLIYVYLIYGMYWMLNIITGEKDNPQGVLIRGIEGLDGPGKVGRWLGLDKSFYGEDLTKSKRIWIAQPRNNTRLKIKKTKRVGVDYAEDWAKKRWRFILIR